MEMVTTSHGWFSLPPFVWTPTEKRLATTTWLGDRVADLAFRQIAKDTLEITVNVSGRWTNAVAVWALETTKAIFGLDRDVESFFREAGPRYAWAKKAGAGRLLRAPTVFEDAMKVLATTNCSWSLTEKMVARLVDALGEPGPSGRKAFPTAGTMAKKTEGYFRDEIRTGYRSDYFRAFAADVATGKLDPESWSNFTGETSELIAQIRNCRGFGAYAAENLCRLLGRHDGLGLDSWCLAKFPKVHGPVDGDVEKAIRNHYEPYGKWKGLAMWLDLTQDWHEDRRFTDPEPVSPKNWT